MSDMKARFQNRSKKVAEPLTDFQCAVARLGHDMTVVSSSVDLAEHTAEAVVVLDGREFMWSLRPLRP